MHNDKESPYTLTLLDGASSWQVVQFSGHEALNQPFRFDIEAIGPTPAMSLDQLLQQPVFLSLGDDIGIHGILHSASREQRGPQRIGYRVVLVPYLQNLDRQPSRRVFHQLDVPAILRQLLEENALPADSYRFELPHGRYPVRPFCIQFDESDLAFVQRLCEEEGIHYHFEHQRDGHVLVLADDGLSFPQEPLLMPFRDEAARHGNEPLIRELFQCRTSPLLTGPVAPQHLQREQQSRRILERLRCRHRQIQGQSSHSELRSGRIIQVSEHPLPHFNDQWLLTEIRHQGQQPSPLTRHSLRVPRRYSNQFTAIPWSTVFRPELSQVRPSIPGLQAARVLGPVGQPPPLDEHGRIQVRLWPSSNPVADDSTGLWLPVAHATPVSRMDASSLPVGGSEVLINFLDSDPDRPVLCATRANPPTPRSTGEPRNDGRLLLDWLINRSDLAP
ncbi:type VI secretion system tip protein VgrG [Pseudomonas sp. PB120]|uniref:type VI secretion system Vgr family protein n=1 Tax=Pseudomonas sp. PB120 TaxID=2494700 RepID=UPI0012FE42F8|nr:contractile injection system protein, VgrG/Pvc8 family [Pseudomonas sp. PB120]MVV50084.1 type VI secretion system tip protein VgrG [Pseudomonas sp. PB120]